MRVALITLTACLLFLLQAITSEVRAQEPPTSSTTPQTGAAQTADTSAGVRPGETRVPLPQVAVAYDAAGRETLAGRLRTQALAGTPEAPVRNTRIVIENRSALFYNYAAGWATFYDAEGVRCGEGLWKLEAFAPNESVEVDTPGLRVTCTPATWRIVATTLLTRTTDTAKPEQGLPAPAEGSINSSTGAGATTTGENGTQIVTTSTPPVTPNVTLCPPLEVNINGKTLPIQFGNPLEVKVGKERVRIILQPVP